MKGSFTIILLLVTVLSVKSQEDFSVFVRLAETDPIVAKYSDDQMRRALGIDKYAEKLRPCAANLDKFFRLRGFKDIIDKPGQNSFWGYLRAFEDNGGAGLSSYAKELNPYPHYNAGQYGGSENSYAEYKKMGIDLRDASANHFPDIFNQYRDSRLSSGSMDFYVLQQMDQHDLNTVKSSLQKLWGTRLGPNPDYNKVVADFYEVQLMVYVEKKLAAIYPTIYKPLLESIPACRETFIAALKDIAEKEKTESLIKSGTYGDVYSKVHVNYSGGYSNGGGYISISFEYTVGDSHGQGLWDCKVDGNKVSGTWTAQHEDDTKTGTRKGTVTATFDGVSMTGEYVEDTPEWNYKQGYSAANISSSMFKGKKWPFSYKLQ
ncbi:MAG: hypothetical protein ABUT20_19875 [Bacteroidota bacterium]